MGDTLRASGRLDVHDIIPEECGLDCGAFSPRDSVALAVICKRIMPRIKNPIMGELGSWIGSSTIATAKEIQKYNGHLIAIDWFKGSTGINKHLAEIAAKTNVYSIFMRNIGYSGVNNVSVLKMDSITASRLISDNYFNIFFIDGDHEYEYVKRDIKLWLPKVKKRGVICGHDYNESHPGVMRAVTKAFKAVKSHANIWWVVK